MTLVERYEELIARLARALGSRETAENALHDTYLRLARDATGDLGEIHNPRSYLFRMALNAATSNRRSEPHWLSYQEGEAFLDALDDRPDPERVSAAASELALVARILGEMPVRRRAIFEAAWIDELPQKEIASRHALSVRMVQIEIKQAMEHVIDRLTKMKALDFVSGLQATSTKEGGDRS